MSLDNHDVPVGASVSTTEDHRREPRRPAEGEVVVRFGEPEQVVEGRLLDVSASGFRFTHHCASLEAGQEVEFAHPEAQGIARIIWNRIAPDGVETGLYLVKA